MTQDNVTDIVERLSCLHVWPQSIGSTYADTLTPRQIERLYDVGNVATEAAEEIISLRKQLENARSEVNLWYSQTQTLLTQVNSLNDVLAQAEGIIAELKGQPC